MIVAPVYYVCTVRQDQERSQGKNQDQSHAHRKQSTKIRQGLSQSPSTYFVGHFSPQEIHA